MLLTFIGALFVSCEKEGSTIEEVSMETRWKEKTANNKNGEVTYISEANFDSEFESFAETFFTDHPHGLIEIEHLPQSAQYALTTEDEGPIDPISNERIVCRGEKSNVIACAQRHAQFNIFGCWSEVSQHSSGMAWIATEVCP